MNDLTDAAAAAAILACEAARQQLEGAPDSPEGRDAPGELEKLYRWYVTQLEHTAAVPTPGQPPAEPAAAAAPARAAVAVDVPADGAAQTPKPAAPSGKEARRAFNRRR